MRSDTANGTLLDSNVLLDILDPAQEWSRWSMEAVEDAGDQGPLVINPIVYAEVSIRFSRVEDVEETFPPDLFVRAPLPWEAAFLAGKCFLDYRSKGGAKRSPLPDFFIGAHAAVMGLRLLTRDGARYRSYFPTVTVIAP